VRPAHLFLQARARRRRVPAGQRGAQRRSRRRRRRRGGALVPGHAQLHDPLGGLRGVPALLHQPRHLGLGQPHPQPHGAVRAHLHGRRRLRRPRGGAGRGEARGRGRHDGRHVRHGAPGQHQALEALPGAHVQRARPRLARRARVVAARRRGAARDLDEEVELPGLERRVAVERARAHAEPAHLLGLEQLVARVAAQRGARRGGGLVPERRAVHRHHLGRAPAAGESVAHGGARAGVLFRFLGRGGGARARGLVLQAEELGGGWG
jgi:hypothetical protein